MQRTRFGAGALALSALLLAGLAFAGSLRQRGLPAQPQAPCVVAELDGVTLSQREVEAMTAAVTPAPAPAEASRLLVDATLAHWVVRGFVAGSSVRARLASYRALSAHLGKSAASGSRHARALLGVLARAGQELSLRTGPCYAAPEQPAPDLAAVGDVELASLRATPRALEMRARASWQTAGRAPSAAPASAEARAHRAGPAVSRRAGAGARARLASGRAGALARPDLLGERPLPGTPRGRACCTQVGDAARGPRRSRKACVR